MNSHNVDHGLSNDQPVRGNVFTAVAVLTLMMIGMAYVISAIWQ